MLFPVFPPKLTASQSGIKEKLLNNYDEGISRKKKEKTSSAFGFDCVSYKKSI